MGLRNPVAAAFTMAMLICGCNQTTPEEHLLRGNALQAKDDHAKAIEEYSEAILLDSEFREAYVRRGESWNRTRRFKRAIADWTMAIRLDDDDPAPYSMRGAAHLILGDCDEAIADYTRAIELKPDGETHRNRGFAWHKKDDPQNAIIDYGEAIRLDPKDHIAYYLRASAWRKSGEFDKALSDCEEALRLSPDDRHALYQRGLVWLERKEFHKAIEYFSRIIEQRPSSALSFQHRADAYEALGENEKAAADLEEHLQPMFDATPDDPFPPVRKKGGTNMTRRQLKTIREMSRNGASVAEIARKAKVSRMTVYRHREPPSGSSPSSIGS